MRSKIKVDGKFYKPMPWLEDGGCTGCDLEGNGCINYDNPYGANPCDGGEEFEGYIFVRMNPEGAARYVANRLEAAA